MMKKRDLHMFKYRSRQVGLLLAIIPVSLTLVLTTGCSRDPNVRKHKYLESGKRYEKDGKYKEASIQFANALKVDRNFSDAHYELAKTYFKLGSVQAGYGELMRTVDLSPNNVQARIDLGQLLYSGNVLDRAQDQAKAVLAIDANNSDAYALLSAIAAKQGDHAGAMADIQRALSIKPNQASYHTALALLLNDDTQGSPQVEQELQKAISLDSKDARAQIVLAAILEKKGDKAAAEEHYLAAVQEDPKNLQARTALAGLYVRSGDKAKAEQTLRKAVEDNPDSEPAAELLKDYYFRTNQADAVEAIFADLTSKNPKSFPIKMTYASILASKGEFAKVQPIADELNKSNSGQPQVQILKGALLLNAGKVDEAFTLLQNTAKTTPNNVQLQLALGKVSAVKGDLGAAEASYHAAEKLSPGNIEVQMGLAQLAIRRGDVNALAAVGDKTIAMHPEFADAYLWRGMAEGALKQYDKAETDLQTVVAKSPDNAVGYAQLGMLRLRQAKTAEGIAMLEKSLDKDPNQTGSLTAIAQVDMAQKQPEKAVARVQQQIAKSPRNPALYTLLATLQMSTKDFNGARDNSKKAMEIDSTDGRAVQLYTQAVTNLGNTDEAVRAWEAWTAANPKDDKATSMLALLEEQTGNKAKAIEYYKKSLEINSSQGLAANNLAYLMVTTGQNADVALSYAQVARRALPDNPNTADTLALVYYYKGTYYSARDLLEDASKKAPDNISIHYHLGMTYNKLGRKVDAVAQLKKAVSLGEAAKGGADSTTGKDAAALLAQIS
jgi:tetratricopeptide (TPR) repeat protein